ncbi:MAG: hypothetical protein P8J52_07045 [Gammaproteobacteria bacterium]|nr:hypothetical protein [Gammaproteobacteria bacterium]MDG2118508.1 hypothetical protein [Gammaproteobacteria bacterium]|tara:strand:+ start:3391 stop:3654 length:264 start_codon:yes stop_codon:yes gene_type:complete
MINRLGLVIHWLGFFALIDFVGLLVYAIAIFHGAGVIEEISRVLFNLNQSFSDMEGWFFLSFWIAVSHWPIKVVLTGNKSFFPWSSR